MIEYNKNADDATWDRDWSRTFTGRQVFPLSVQPEDVDIRDIAHHTAMQCRYNGGTRIFYSVAEHCIHISAAILVATGNRVAALQGLIHDANETYTGDMTRPVKNSLKRFYKEWECVEKNNELSIAQALEVPYPFDPIVKEYDKRIIVNEKTELYGRHKPWDWNYEPLDIIIRGWDWADAEKHYLEQYGKLTGNWAAYKECVDQSGAWAL